MVVAWPGLLIFNRQIFKFYCVQIIASVNSDSEQTCENAHRLFWFIPVPIQSHKNRIDFWHFFKGRHLSHTVCSPTHHAPSEKRSKFFQLRELI